MPALGGLPGWRLSAALVRAHHSTGLARRVHRCLGVSVPGAPAPLGVGTPLSLVFAWGWAPPGSGLYLEVGTPLSLVFTWAWVPPPGSGLGQREERAPFRAALEEEQRRKQHLGLISTS